MQGHDAPRRLVFHDNGHRAPLDSLAERNATTASETGVREAFQHDVRIILQQGLDLPLELFLGGDAGVLLRDDAVAPDDYRHRNAEQRAKGILDVFASIADE